MLKTILDDNEISDEDAIKKFLLDIECLDPLDEWTNKFNLFDILKITRTEIRHSNLLAWLLNPNENHNLGDCVLKGLVQHYVKLFSKESDVVETLLKDFNDSIVFREWKNIDILVVSENEKFVICIENKIFSKEHDNQLQRYMKDVEDTYQNFKKIFIYLSPEGADASAPEFWCSMSYSDVLEIIEKSKKKHRLSAEATFLIDNYIDAIRRDIVEDKKLAQICAEIYTKHQKALDLIFENKPDKALDLFNIIMKWAQKKSQDKEIILVEDKCSKTYIRFLTEYMNTLIPESEEADSGWKTKSHYFYEIKNDYNSGKKISIQLVLNSTNCTDEQREIFEKLNMLLTDQPLKSNWVWRTCFSSKQHKIDDELDEEKIFKALEQFLKYIKDNEQEIAKKI